ncbi:hypothetical protein GGP45_001486 [Salinibacter ruber]|uniref:Uncharacterized protein n=1 Tax=Salinibacter ruber TaxID=146919 RepID=A0A9X2V750_9BACT|nr:hypothetical protein [Salinibacter ruber]
MQRQANGPVKNPSHSLLVQSLGSHRGNGQEAFRGLKAKVDGSPGHRCVRRRRHSRLSFTGPPGTATPFVIGYPGQLSYAKRSHGFRSHKKQRPLCFTRALRGGGAPITNIGLSGPRGVFRKKLQYQTTLCNNGTPVRKTSSHTCCREPNRGHSRHPLVATSPVHATRLPQWCPPVNRIHVRRNTRDHSPRGVHAIYSRSIYSRSIYSRSVKASGARRRRE